MQYYLRGDELRRIGTPRSAHASKHLGLRRRLNQAIPTGELQPMSNGTLFRSNNLSARHPMRPCPCFTHLACVAYRLPP